MKLVIFVEGGQAKGGVSNASTNYNQRQMKQGFYEFFVKVLKAKNVKDPQLRIELGAGRDQTYKQFKKALPDPPGVFSILLVDAEEEVTENDSRKHLKQRKGDQHWDLTGVDEAQCHLMVQTMEAWFLADPDALRASFPQDFDARKLRLAKGQNVEKVEKQGIMTKLGAATNGKYTERTKLEYSGRILLELNPTQLEKKSSHCRKLFSTLETKA